MWMELGEGISMSADLRLQKDIMKNQHVSACDEGIDLCRIARELSLPSGEDFFQSLVESLARLLNVETVIIGELPGTSQLNEIRTLAVFSQDHLVENFTYLLAPCEQLACQRVCVIADDALATFPEDHLLSEMGARSYVGMPLLSSAGQSLGLIALHPKQPLENPDFITALLSLFAIRAASELERRQQESHFRNLYQSVEQSPSIVVITDLTGRIEYVNPSFCRITGHQMAEAIGKNPGFIKSGVIDLAVYESLWQTILDGGTWRGELENRKTDGELYWESATISPVHDKHGNPTHFLKVSEDITTRKKAEDKIQEMTHYDRLTGLANLYSFNGFLYRAIESIPQDGRFAVVFLDIDEFSKFNHTFGHITGNSILMEASARLSECLNEGDFIARHSADTFLLLLADIGQTGSVVKRVKQLQNAFVHPFPLLSEGEYSLSCGMGVSVFPDDTNEPGALLQMADTALSEAKLKGRNSIQRYSTMMNAENLRLLNLENDLRSAIVKDELRVYYQPQVDAVSGRLLGLEALARWQHPVLGLVSPGEFIPLAEDVGLIADIGSWVMSQACQHAQQLLREGISFERVAVNISAHQFFHQNLVNEVKAALKSSGLKAEILEVEITESAIMLDPDGAQSVLEQIRALGVNVAMDDFGTGYSSLSYLRRFPINRLKVDRSFVFEIESSEDDAAIVKTIINMAKTLNLSVLAEGVETDFQRDSLATWGCHEFQGFLFARPMPLQDLSVWARANLLETEPVQDPQA